METEHVSHHHSEGMKDATEVNRKLSSGVGALSPELFLSGAAASIALSLALRISGRQHDAHFVGQWAPTLLLLGLYAGRGRALRGLSRRYVPESDAKQEVH
jgi:hypothetical protein